MHADAQPAGFRDGDRRGFVELPPGVGRGPELVKAEGPALQGPYREVIGDLLPVDGDVDAVEQAGRRAPVVGVAQLELESGDPVAVHEVAETPALNDVSVEHEHVSLPGG